MSIGIDVALGKGFHKMIANNMARECRAMLDARPTCGFDGLQPGTTYCYKPPYGSRFELLTIGEVTPKRTQAVASIDGREPRRIYKGSYHARERATAARSGLEQRGRVEPGGLGMGGLLDRKHAAVLQRAGLSRVPARPERPGRAQAERQVRLLERQDAARGIPASATTYRERNIPCPIMR